MLKTKESIAKTAHYVKVPDKPISFFDCDDTLVLWPPGGQPKPGYEDEYIIIIRN